MSTQPLEDWNSDICDCFEDASTCCYGFWCCPCLASTVTVRSGENRCLPICDACCVVAFLVAKVPLIVPPSALSLRVAMRHKYGIKGSICRDLGVSCCCSWCSWCQMHRELKHRNKAPNVVTVEQPSVLQLQPAPGMMAAYPPKAAFVDYPGSSI
ncbi:cornifelin homolog B-like [Pungitius pungitius]|uniref:cornifelin homolog B-like n=1 Tax=Pungitius pungitius TaxID=134920 RepID=UPI0018874B7A|nr:cornifelin homolog B-like [Pungitius pungitius]